MIVVIISASAVSAELIKFADRETVHATVVERVKDRDAVGSERNGTTHQCVSAGDRLVSKFWLERNLPRVGALVFLRQRHLLLPRGDADHHHRRERRVRKSVAFNIEPALVGACLYERRERVEDRGLRRFLRVNRIRIRGVRVCRFRLRRIQDRLVDRENRFDALRRFDAISTREIVDRNCRDVARRRRDRNLARSREEEGTIDDFARARVRPRATRREVELIRRMCVDDARERKGSDQVENEAPSIVALDHCCCICFSPESNQGQSNPGQALFVSTASR